MDGAPTKTGQYGVGVPRTLPRRTLIATSQIDLDETDFEFNDASVLRRREILHVDTNTDGIAEVCMEYKCGSQAYYQNNLLGNLRSQVLIDVKYVSGPCNVTPKPRNVALPCSGSSVSQKTPFCFKEPRVFGIKWF